MKEISDQYPYVVVDNEAGLENLSRRIVQRVDLLVFVSDSSQRGMETVHRLYLLAQEMEIQYDKLAIIINRLSGINTTERMEQLKADTHADFLVSLPVVDDILKFSESGKDLFRLTEKNPVIQKIDTFLNEELKA